MRVDFLILGKGKAELSVKRVECLVESSNSLRCRRR